MHIVLCGSMSFLKKMEDISAQLEKMGHTTTVPMMTENEIKQFELQGGNEAEFHYDKMSDADRAHHKNSMMTYYFGKINESDAILVVNESRKSIDNYIGANTFLEMGAAFIMNKPIFTLNPLPEQPNKDELLGLLPIIINQDLEKISL